MNVLPRSCRRAASVRMVRGIAVGLLYGSQRLKKVARQLLSVKVVLRLKERQVEFAYPFFLGQKGLFTFCLVVPNALLPTWVPTTNSRINAVVF